VESEEKIQAHILSIWKENRGFFSGKGKEGMLILTNRRLLFIKKTEAGIKLLQSKDVMVVEDGYGEEKLRTDLENKKNQKISFDNILYIEAKEKVWGTVLLLDIIEGGKEKKFQFSVVQDWVKYPISAPMKYLKVDWSRFVKYIQDKRIVTK